LREGTGVARQPVYEARYRAILDAVRVDAAGVDVDAAVAMAVSQPAMRLAPAS
jgi:hypothetical protein